MKPEDVPAELVEKAADEILAASFGQELPESPDHLARHALAAVLPSARLAVLEELRDEIAAWRPYDTRDIGDAFLADSVVDLVADRIDDLVRKELTHG
ncbi:hypothetical protein [Promicromonospora kroppenstedtii]|uniref:hypothetical protein n=1 Tax=Promicromonospora kroppenstedtii TaxID=440482 RepID=UPI0004BB9184|nr:hypothetical protein [Promicromonospora kroppenstedtii]